MFNKSKKTNGKGSVVSYKINASKFPVVFLFSWPITKIKNQDACYDKIEWVYGNGLSWR
jgi:hypothetical protein